MIDQHYPGLMPGETRPTPTPIVIRSASELIGLPYDWIADNERAAGRLLDRAEYADSIGDVEVALLFRVRAAWIAERIAVHRASRKANFSSRPVQR